MNKIEDDSFKEYLERKIVEYYGNNINLKYSTNKDTLSRNSPFHSSVRTTVDDKYNSFLRKRSKSKSILINALEEFYNLEYLETGINVIELINTKGFVENILSPYIKAKKHSDPEGLNEECSEFYDKLSRLYKVCDSVMQENYSDFFEDDEIIKEKVNTLVSCFIHYEQVILQIFDIRVGIWEDCKKK